MHGHDVQIMIHDRSQIKVQVQQIEKLKSGIQIKTKIIFVTISIG